MPTPARLFTEWISSPPGGFKDGAQRRRPALPVCAMAAERLRSSAAGKVVNGDRVPCVAVDAAATDAGAALAAIAAPLSALGVAGPPLAELSAPGAAPAAVGEEGGASDAVISLPSGAAGDEIPVGAGAGASGEDLTKPLGVAQPRSGGRSGASAATAAGNVTARDSGATTSRGDVGLTSRGDGGLTSRGDGGTTARGDGGTTSRVSLMFDSNPAAAAAAAAAEAATMVVYGSAVRWTPDEASARAGWSPTPSLPPASTPKHDHHHPPSHTHTPMAFAHGVIVSHCDRRVAARARSRRDWTSCGLGGRILVGRRARRVGGGGCKRACGPPRRGRPCSLRRAFVRP